MEKRVKSYCVATVATYRNGSYEPGSFIGASSWFSPNELRDMYAMYARDQIDFDDEDKGKYAYAIIDVEYEKEECPCCGQELK